MKLLIKLRILKKLIVSRLLNSPMHLFKY